MGLFQIQKCYGTYEDSAYCFLLFSHIQEIVILSIFYAVLVYHFKQIAELI